MASQDIFADGIGEITLSGGMVRMDFVRLVGSQNDAENKPRLEYTASRNAAGWFSSQL